MEKGEPGRVGQREEPPRSGLGHEKTGAGPRVDLRVEGSHGRGCHHLWALFSPD